MGLIRTLALLVAREGAFDDSFHARKSQENNESKQCGESDSSMNNLFKNEEREREFDEQK